MHTIQSLRQQGYKVRATIKRYSSLDTKIFPAKKLQKDESFLFLQKDLPSDFRSPKGGSYAVEITTPAGQNLRGIAVCSLKDAFNKKTGQHLAVNRAMANEST